MDFVLHCGPCYQIVTAERQRDEARAERDLAHRDLAAANARKRALREALGYEWVVCVGERYQCTNCEGKGMVRDEVQHGKKCVLRTRTRRRRCKQRDQMKKKTKKKKKKPDLVWVHGGSSGSSSSSGDSSSDRGDSRSETVLFDYWVMGY